MSYSNYGSASYGSAAAAAAAAGAPGGGQPPRETFLSEVEQALVGSKQPLLNLTSNEQISAGPFRGSFLNKHEADRWRGPIPIEEYPINNDPNPEKLKRKQDKIKYTQELGVRYLKPPQPPKPGDLVIRERNVSLPPAPPLVIRQQAERARTPPPQIFREAPPPLPPRIPEQVVEVDVVEPPTPRRVIVERIAAAPAPPPSLIVEKWLPYQPQKRRVRYERAPPVQPVVPRNMVITWEAPDVEVQTVCKDLGVVEADPEDYVRRHGQTLLKTHELPTCTNGLTGAGSVSNKHAAAALASASNVIISTSTSSSSSTTTTSNCPIHYGSNSLMRTAVLTNAPTSGSQFETPELEGDIEALKLIELDKHGLSAYRSIVTSVSGGYTSSSSVSSITITTPRF